MWSWRTHHLRQIWQTDRCQKLCPKCCFFFVLCTYFQSSTFNKPEQNRETWKPSKNIASLFCWHLPNLPGWNCSGIRVHGLRLTKTRQNFKCQTVSLLELLRVKVDNCNSCLTIAWQLLDSCFTVASQLLRVSGWRWGRGKGNGKSCEETCKGRGSAASVWFRVAPFVWIVRLSVTYQVYLIHLNPS